MNSPATWDQETFAAAVGDAVWAPSIHNSQPWRFRRTEDGVDVLVDQRRVLPVSDPEGRAARVSCGATVFNLGLALAVAGAPAVCTVRPGGASVHLARDVGRAATPLERRLHRQIRRRHTNRAPFAETHVDAGVVTQLEEAVAREGGWLDFAADEPTLTSLAALTRQADAQLRVNPRYVAELRAWSESADLAVEGVGRQAAGAAPHPAELMPRRDFGGPEHDDTRDPTRGPAVAVFGVHGDHAVDEIRAGIVLQRLLLLAADLGLAVAMYSQPIEMPVVRERLRLAVRRAHSPQLVLRFGYAPTTCYTNRRPVADVIVADAVG
ncbi:nitroreductase [Dactylosporangium sp. NBC_01737]|uniref:Acg family FMN-binding oxidoreductase n=1 Tax=Dactylosporangium sp. NBC_01737 TaxID=2975959 RepID=UPI002E14917B|nr:nitroreductase [Dactylosporangium sp. NBC_01737]